MNRRLLPLAAATLALGIAVSGCSSSPEPGTASSKAADGLTLQEVKDAGVLTVGTEGTYKPFSYHEGGAGELTGYDVEVVTAVADKLGVKPEFKETQWDAIFAGLESGRFDVIANQVTMDAQRKKTYDFSTPYTISKGVIVTKADNNDITSFADLKGKTTAQSLTSNWKSLAEKSGAKVQGVEGWAQSVTLLKQGRVDATINDQLTYLDYQKSTPDQGIKIAAETKDTSEAALAFPKGSDDLVKAVDSALAELQKDGTLAKISEKYFGEDVSK
ncbi:amino acid ABC transporter substrate-binding protein [Arthrobacter sp.]|uniref:amino acid ABC transporter substrate-binding protein n=1 Tax=Arthrobacter sp. TaxID=1667 RepID=UPI003A8DCF5C